MFSSPRLMSYAGVRPPGDWLRWEKWDGQIVSFITRSPHNSYLSLSLSLPAAYLSALRPDLAGYNGQTAG